MFRPFKGTCNECERQRWIVVRSGLCNMCNETRKNTSGNNSLETKEQKVLSKEFKKSKKIQHRRKSTGELEVFKILWNKALEAAGPDGPRCQCCGGRLGLLFNITFFSHLLSKGLYPAYRLLKENIWIICFDCHFDWGNKSRNQPKFEEKLKEYERLKIQYNEQFRIN